MALAGHDVTVFEQETKLGDRLATRHTDSGFFDYGTPFIYPRGDEFKDYVKELRKKDILFNWTRSFQHFDGTQLHKTHPNRDLHVGTHYASKKGINAIADNFKRWVEVEAAVRVGGITHIGADRSRKRSWMINRTDISVFECDAVIVATDAVNATGILSTTQDETAARRISRNIDEIDYYPRYSLMISTGDDVPEWQGIDCEDSHLEWIGNDSSKSENQKGLLLTLQSSGAFAEAHEQADRETIIDEMLKTASEIIDIELLPNEAALHFWNFYEPKKTLDDYFMELEMDEAPLALVGDYFNEWSVESAYLSGSYLADYWIEKFKEENKQSVIASGR